MPLKGMHYTQIKKVWHFEFLAALKRRGITRHQFLERTKLCRTNGSCYYKGTKIASPVKIAKMCKQVGIPVEEVFGRNITGFFAGGPTAQPRVLS